jgi:hypothetical protein
MPRGDPSVSEEVHGRLALLEPDVAEQGFMAVDHPARASRARP